MQTIIFMSTIFFAYTDTLPAIGWNKIVRVFTHTFIIVIVDFISRAYFHEL